MTWTPGLVLDYARALHRVVEPPPVPWPVMIGQALTHWYKLRGDRQLVPKPPGRSAA